MENGFRITPWELITLTRRRKGLTIVQISERTGLSVPTICKIEHGALTVRFSALVKVLNELNIQITFVARESDDNKGEPENEVGQSSQED